MRGDTSKIKTHSYILVLTPTGPVFVTKIEYSPKVAYWDEMEKPYEMSRERAEDLALGLSLNGSMALPVTVHYEIESQPYLYNKGEFKWVWNEDEKGEENG